MPIYHFSVKNISRNHPKTRNEEAPEKPPRSILAAAAYRAGERLVDEMSGKVYDYTRKSGVDHKEIIAPEDAPFWTSDQATLWNAVEHENWRKNARFAKEITIALPKELDDRAKIGLVREFVTAEIVDRFNLIADACFHKLDSENPHVHILVPIREAKEEGFSDRVKGIEARKTICELRKAWSDYCNRHLSEAGVRQRVDHRNFKERGIDREPQRDIGAAAWAMEARGIRTRKGDRLREIDRQNRERDRDVR